MGFSMRRALLASLLTGPLLVVACGSDDGGGSGNQLCDDVRSKLDQCGIVILGGVPCDPGATEEQKCDARCITTVTCSDLVDATKASPYLACQIQCSGFGSDAFICDNLEYFIPRTSVCNGTPQCPDGSDENNCGTSDAGSD